MSFLLMLVVILLSSLKKKDCFLSALLYEIALPAGTLFAYPVVFPVHLVAIRYYSQPNRALAARLRATTYGLRWVLPIAEGDF